MRMLGLAVVMVGCAPDAEIVDRRALDVEGMATGVAMDTDGSLVLTTQGGLYADGVDEPLVDWLDLQERGFPSELTDVAALGDGKYALTVPGVGVLYDRAEDSLEEFFCYEPDAWGDWGVQRQETRSLAYDPVRERLISQPQTLTGESVDRTDVAEFDRTTGQPVAWHTLKDADFLATAVAVHDGEVLVARDGVLYDYTLGSDRLQRRISLSSLGIDNIEGLVVDGEQLIVLDAAHSELVWVEGW